jgi:uncharacterized protein YigE (DUF2233 family)
MSALLLALMTTMLTAQQPSTWAELETGVSYRQVTVPTSESWGPGQLHVFRISLNTHRLVPLDARSATRKRATVEALASDASALLVVNGTYFDERSRPLGLLVGSGRELNPVRHADWGVFYIHKGRAHLVHTTEWRRAPVKQPEFAIQVGPRCVVDGKPVKLKPQIARRAALGIQNDGSVLIVISTGELLSADLARAMANREADGGLGCVDAVMLDGGGSAQLWATSGTRRWRISGSWPVPNAIAVRRR